ncbi:MAG: endo-1,4-beta-xylanase [Bernardetiaceae bacterium]|jgi:endo-1,4-beta-xylanase|nr:endo-1,4-beta-xylanase [Bernardetiaceae bacterium]
MRLPNPFFGSLFFSGFFEKNGFLTQAGWLLAWLGLTFAQAQAQPAPLPLREVAKFPVGAAFDPRDLTRYPLAGPLVKREYSRITPENVMKMRGLRPSAQEFAWQQADSLVAIAQANGQRVHGHALLWHESVPDWVTKFVGDSAAWENLLRTHITTVMARYRGRLVSWDVVNEAFDDQGQPRNSIWRQKLGPDYLARCFRYARAADPAAKLFYNDYGQEYSPAKAQAILQMVADFKRRGVPIDGLGLQMHIHIDTDRAGITRAIREAAGTGLLVHVSELDVSLNPKSLPQPTLTDSLLQQQADFYRHVVQEYYREVPAPQRHGITTWNIGDADTWIRSYFKRQDWPLPFDDRYQPKPAYRAFHEALQVGR